MTIARLGKFGMLALATACLTTSAGAASKARIVRLSEVEGMVQMDRATGDGFDKAFNNLPVIEGCKLRTGKDGRAEVEFEDGSAVRLGPQSELDFTHLSLGDDGQKITDLQFVSGVLYANLHPKNSGRKGDMAADQIQIDFGRESIVVPEPAHFRVVFDGKRRATLAAFKGRISARGPAGEYEVSEKRGATITFAKVESEAATADAKSDTANAVGTLNPAKSEETKTDSENVSAAKDDAAKSDSFVLAKNYQENPADAWDRQQSDYHDRYASSAGNAKIESPYGYGMSDLNYYGSFTTLAGYGSVWQPFFVNGGWDPFQDGAWAFYPGAGYMFVSGYPWGWMPYNYGSWLFLPGFGWGWQPGYWNSTYGVPTYANPPARTKALTSPASGRQTVMVGLGLTAYPAAGGSQRVTIKPGSAGFGVPRGLISHLDHASRTMERTSRPMTFAAAPPPSMQPSASMTGFGSPAGMSPMTSAPHRSAGTAPPSHH